MTRLQTLPFANDSIETVASALGAEAVLAPFQLPGAAVYQITLNGADGHAAALVTLWPSLGRVDAVGGGAVVVFTRIATVQLVNDVEVQFRRDSGDYLIVTTQGRIIVKS